MTADGAALVDIQAERVVLQVQPALDDAAGRRHEMVGRLGYQDQGVELVAPQQAGDGFAPGGEVHGCTPYLRRLAGNIHATDPTLLAHLKTRRGCRQVRMIFRPDWS